jgi:hypothetical protein
MTLWDSQPLRNGSSSSIYNHWEKNLRAYNHWEMNLRAHNHWETTIRALQPLRNDSSRPTTIKKRLFEDHNYWETTI